MNTLLHLTLGAVLLAAAQPALAHDPAEHAQEAAAAKAAPNCTGMDRARLDPNDPVSKALMIRCGNHPKPDEGQHLRGGDHAGKTKPAADSRQPDTHGGH